eukprot:CAMPEP_0168319870 /NCGR_PEP_ID=MMETSP0213-20121227/1311_1 /TAXON_ID=151035 /ORGANISM="Euplotes harpa, Strain FSP1.4" /LENGTH=53 /DNA_ID=CAMNT_0008321169 /DNA_START=11 /DNA_END=172 /DNA_ORIENTATION=+
MKFMQKDPEPKKTISVDPGEFAKRSSVEHCSDLRVIAKPSRKICMLSISDIRK